MQQSDASIGSLALVIPIVAGAFAFSLRQAYRRNKEAWVSFELIVSDDTLTRRASSFADIVIRQAEIRRIVERSDGGLTIHGPSTNTTIFVPAALENRAELMAILTSWYPVEKVAAQNRGLVYNLLAAGVSLAVFAACFMASDPRVVVPAGLVFGLGILWCGWYIRRSAHLDERVRKKAWIVVLPAMAALYRVSQVLSV